MKQASSVTDLIGETPVLKYPLVVAFSSLFLKLERFNPTFSYKDRAALNMVEEAERARELLPGGTIIEASSGNTADSLAMIAAAKGYKFIAVVDDFCSPEKIASIKAFGGSVVQIKSEGGVPAINDRRKLAQKIAHDTPGGYWTRQADNPANPNGYAGLATELVHQVPRIDTLIGAVGTGGSLCGTARSLRAQGQEIDVIGVEPKGSIIFSNDGHEYLQCGSGAPRGTILPKNIDRDQIDQSAQVSDAVAFTTCNFLAQKLGLMVGGSAGGVVFTALKFVTENRGRTAAVLLADAGEKYLDTVFNADWMEVRKLHDQEAWDYLVHETRFAFSSPRVSAGSKA